MRPPRPSPRPQHGRSHDFQPDLFMPPIVTAEDRLRKVLGDGLLTQEPLRHHTTFRIGGPADFYIAARTPDELVSALRAAHELKIPSFLLGGGSNLLVSDEGFRGLVVRNAIDSIDFDGT